MGLFQARCPRNKIDEKKKSLGNFFKLDDRRRKGLHNKMLFPTMFPKEKGLNYPGINFLWAEKDKLLGGATFHKGKRFKLFKRTSFSKEQVLECLTRKYKE